MKMLLYIYHKTVSKADTKCPKTDTFTGQEYSQFAYIQDFESLARFLLVINHKL